MSSNTTAATTTEPEIAESACRAAHAAAEAAGVEVRELTCLADFEQATGIFDAIWKPDPKNAPVSTELLRALTKAGNYVGGAFDGTKMFGACVGFFEPPAQHAMHSHVAGVSPAGLGRHIGFALKLHQRAWALQRDIHTIQWTFDPLVCRNAYFDLGKLAAVPVEYIPNFYGVMNDAINGREDTDRLLVRWSLTAAQAVAASNGAPAIVDAARARTHGATVALDVSHDGSPMTRILDGDTVLVAVPTDIERLRVADPETAAHWRVALRETLGVLMSRGYVVSGFDRTGWYVLSQDEEGRS